MSRVAGILLFSVFQLVGSASGQHTLRGLILHHESGAPVADALIYDDVSQRIVESDASGRFVLNDLSSGAHNLTFSSLELNTLIQNVEINGDLDLTFYMSPLRVELTAVEIAARREEIFGIKQLAHVEDMAIFAGKKSEVVLVDLISGNLANNVSRQIYAQVAGLNIYEGIDGGLQLAIGGRGLNPNRTSNFNTRQNGYDISADVLGYPENYYTPPSEAIDEIQIIRGASSLQYGTQFGGLINFKLRQPPSNKKLDVRLKQTIGSFGLFNSFNEIGVQAGPVHLRGYYNFKTGDGYRPNSQFDAHNAFLQAGIDLSERTKISAEFTLFNYLAQQGGGLTDQQFTANPQMSTRERNWFEVDWKLYQLKLEHAFDAGSDLSISLFGLDASRKSLGFNGDPTILNQNPITALDERDQNGNFILPRDLMLGEFRNYGMEARYLKKYQINDREAVLLVGAKYYDSNNTSMQGPGSRDIDADFSLRTSEFPDYANQSDFQFPNLNLALFGEHIFYLSPQLSLTPGFRMEYIRTRSRGTYNDVVFDNAGNAISNTLQNEQKDLSRTFILFGLGLEYKTDALNLYANLSQNYRSVTFSDIRVVSPTFIIDPDISDERGVTGDLGVRGRIDNKVSFDIGLYTVLYDDRIGIILDDRANRVRKNIGKAVIAGLESLAEFRLDRMTKLGADYKMTGFFNVAYTYSRYLQSEENNVEGKHVEFVPTFNLKTGIKFGYKNLLSAFQFSYLSEQFTDVQNSPAAPPGDNRSGIIGEIPAYHIADFSLAYRFGQVSLEGGINNVFDQAYFTRRATGYPGPGIIPSDGRSFYLGVSWEF